MTPTKAPLFKHDTNRSLDEVPGEKTEVGTILTCRPLLKAESWCEATLSDLSNGKLGDAYRGLGLTRVSFWLQRDPDVAIVMWEGTDIDTLFERYATSSDVTLARWRHQLSVFSGPEVAEGFWDASRHRLFSWASGEQGTESWVNVYREPSYVDMYRQLSLDFQHDPALLRLLDRVRRRQGFTRVETWHQQTNGDDIVLTLVEADDLNAATAQFLAEDNALDKRILKLLRGTLFRSVSSHPTATLLARWHA